MLKLYNKIDINKINYMEDFYYIFLNYLSASLFSVSTIYQICRIFYIKKTLGIMLTTVFIRLVAFFIFLPYLIHFKIYHTVYTILFQIFITVFLICLVCYYRYWKKSDDVDFSMYLIQK